MTSLQCNAYNVDIAKKFGVLSAVLLSALDRATENAKSTNKYDEEKGVVVCRNSIHCITGLSDEERSRAENILTTYGAVEIIPVKGTSDKSYYKIIPDRVCGKDAVSFEDLFSEPVTEKKTRKKGETKTQAHINMLKGKIFTDVPVLQQAYCDWIDSVYEMKKGIISVQSIQIQQDELYKYANGDADKMVEILKIATVNGYRNLEWAINRYAETQGKKGSYSFASYSDIKSDGANSVNEVF